MNQINLDEAREYLLKLLPQAGETLRKYFISGQFTTKSKGGVDVLTQADQEIDDFLKLSLKNHFPQCGILTEESAPKDYSSLKDLDNVWIIDPVDGTVNFARGNPNFAISIGLVDKGIPKLGVVLIPMTKDIYWAQQDQEKAFLNNKPIYVSLTNQLEETVVGFGWPWNLQKRLNMTKMLDKISTNVRQLQALGSAVSDLAGLAKGKIDVYIHSGLKPWDTAASALFIQKAGGKVTTPTGETWDVFTPEMLATNGTLHGQILSLLTSSK